MKSKLCESCAHTRVCFLDKNVVGDGFVMPNPMFFDVDEAWKKYEERKAAGFPCKEYLSAEAVQALFDKEKEAEA